MDNELILRKIERIEGKLKVNDSTIKEILQYLQSLNSRTTARKKVGYKLPKES